MSASRRRSRSPIRESTNIHADRRRSRSPHKSSSRHQTARSHDESRTKRYSLPFQSRPLHKSDYTSYRVLFAEYLDLQKHLDLYTLSDHEARGRWKSFLGKWNRGELAEGWYDPAMKARLDERSGERSPPRSQEVPVSVARGSTERRPSSRSPSARADNSDAKGEDIASDEDDFGPSLPDTPAFAKKSGPTMPIPQDLQVRREMVEEERAARIANAKEQRKAERKVQTERLNEIAPRAEPGTRERQLEKKRETAAANRSFREARSPGAEDVNERDLMGDDGIASYKAEKRAQERRKSEREIRKEESLRVRIAEREERMAEHRKKEDKTMEMLKALARQRFG